VDVRAGSGAAGRTTGPGWRPLAALLGAAGALHLVVPAPFAAIVPRALGDPRPWVAWSGVAEIACAAGLRAPRTRAAAGWATAALLVAVYPANLVMARQALRSPRASAARRAVTVARLPLQAPLVWWATAVARGARDPGCAPGRARWTAPDPDPQEQPMSTSPEPAGPPSRDLAAHALRGAVAGVAAGVLATAATSALAAWFARAVVTPQRHRPDDTEVLAVGDGEVVLRATADTVVPGRYGLALAAGTGHARVGEVRGRDGRAGTVTREVLAVDAGALVPGPARWSGVYFDGDPTSALGLPHEDVEITSDVGPLPAWSVPAPRPADPTGAGVGDAPGASAAGRTWAVLVHGRGATREECLRALPLLQRLGVPALVPSYRNDGEAPSSPAGSYGLGDTEWVDVEAAVLHALRCGAREVVLFGWSMGGAIVLQHLARSWTASSVRAVVLDAPVLDWRHVLDHHARLNRVPRGVGRYGLGMLGSPAARQLVGVDGPVDLRRLDWVRRADELDVPVLVVHSADDEYVPVGPSRELAAKRPDLVTLVEFTGARHCKEWNVDSERWEREVARFLLDHL
jgi:hypothetical protein